MADDPRLDDLLLDWENAEARGVPVSPEKLCQSCPDLLGPLRERIGILTSMRGVLDVAPFADEAVADNADRDNAVADNAVVEAQGPPAPPGFLLLQKLGRGGMGVVYKAWQLGAERMVALKMIAAGRLGESGVAARFQAEARAISRLQHPHIVKVLQADLDQGVPFLVMEYVEGPNLKTLLAGRPLTMEQSAGLLETLARTIHFAHEQGIIHRDLKPANILMQNTETLIPKIADFGLARQPDLSQKLTATGTVMGTPGYMAPEQAAGQNTHIGPPSDVFSLGVILYEMLTGVLPYDARLGYGTLDGRLQIPSILNPACPPALEAICVRCLQLAPADRYPRALDLAEDLRRFQQGLPLAAQVKELTRPEAQPRSLRVLIWLVFLAVGGLGAWLLLR